MVKPNHMILGIILALILASCSKDVPEADHSPAEDYSESPEVIARTSYYVAPPPAGHDRNPGTLEEPWATWDKAFNSLAVGPGDTVYFRGGVYAHTRVEGGRGYDCTRKGNPDSWVHYFNYPGEKPILDCDNIRTVGNKNYPLYMRYLSHVHFKGLTIRNVWQIDGEDEVNAWHIGRSEHVKIENCVIYNTHGLAFGATNSNEIYYINCDAYNNCDSLTTVPASNPMPGNDGSGFSDFNWDNSDTRVYYQYCRAWNCGDQGFTSGSDGYTEYEGCWSFKNGLLEGGGHGFKMGWVQHVDPAIVNRVYKNCIAAYNRRYGFDSNDQGYYSGTLRLYNNTSYHNGYFNEGKVAAGFIVYKTLSTQARELERVYLNNISFANEHGDILIIQDGVYTHERNSWDDPPGIVITEAAFLSTDSTGLSGPRKADGSLPDLDFLKLSPDSPAIDAGTKATGLPYRGDAPDLGAFESQ